MALTLLTTLAALMALAPKPVSAQDSQPQAEFEGRLEVTEVLLDVLVTDRSGNVILGLGAEDFIVEQAGEAVDVTSATFYSNRRFVDTADVAGRLGVASNEVPVDRYFILFIQDPRRNSNTADLSISDLTRPTLTAVRRMKEWVYNEMLPNDWVAVVGWDARLLVYQDFTTDNQALIDALNMVAKGKSPGDLWESRVDIEKRGPSLTANLPRGRDLRKQSTRIYNAISTVADASGYIVGRKNLMLFSLGFGNTNDFGTTYPDERYYADMMQALNDNNVAVYAIPWFENYVIDFATTETLGDGLSLLASDTGGRYFMNFRDFEEPLAQVTEDNNGYYLLSYSAQHPSGEQGYEKVEVKTVNPDFVIRARQGYRYGS